MSLRCKQIKTVYDNLIAKRARIRGLITDWPKAKKNFSFQKLWEDANVALHEADLIVINNSRYKARVPMRDSYIARIMKKLEIETGNLVHLMPTTIDGSFSCREWFMGKKTDKAKALAAIMNHPRNPISELAIEEVISVQSGAEIFKAFRSPFCRLGGLSIHGGFINSEHIKDIAEALIQPNCSLSVLDLAENSLADEGTIKLSEVLSLPQCRLQTLDLEANNISDIGAEAILRALRNPACKIRYIRLGRNPKISLEVADELRYTRRVWILDINEI